VAGRAEEEEEAEQEGEEVVGEEVVVEAWAHGRHTFLPMSSFGRGRGNREEEEQQAWK